MKGTTYHYTASFYAVCPPGTIDEAGQPVEPWDDRQHSVDGAITFRGDPAFPTVLKALAKLLNANGTMTGPLAIQISSFPMCRESFVDGCFLPRKPKARKARKPKA